VAVSPDGRFAAVAVENERQDDKKPMPQAPAGYLLIIDLEGQPAQWTTRKISLTGLPIRFPTDPEPEYISINAQNEAAVTLQENNAVAIVSLETGKILEAWDCGTVSHPADLQKDGKIELSNNLTNARREPDGIAWTPQGNLITANEGDYTLDLNKKNNEFAGGRNFTIFSRQGQVVFDSGDEMERMAVAAGAYDDDRSKKKGIEPEGVVVWQQDGKNLAFISCERAMGGGLYEISNERAPRFAGWLKTGSEPEGVVAIPQHNLLLTANEGNGTVSVFLGKRIAQ
jgi:DNA-binding beta-propeller fold protein YncE